jgi:hypothetical protein
MFVYTKRVAFLGCCLFAHGRRSSGVYMNESKGVWQDVGIGFSIAVAVIHR